MSTNEWADCASPSQFPDSSIRLSIRRLAGCPDCDVLSVVSNASAAAAAAAATVVAANSNSSGGSSSRAGALALEWWQAGRQAGTGLAAACSLS